MGNKKRSISDHEWLLTAVAIESNLADAQKVSEAVEQALVDTDLSYVDALKKHANLDDDVMATLDRLVDARAAQFDGDKQAALTQTLNNNPEVKNSMVGLPSLDPTLCPSDTRVEGQKSQAKELPVSDRYDLSEVFAQGGLGQIWRAHDRLLARDVAIKQILPRATSVQSVQQRFLREAKITGQLEHPSIVPVYDIGRLPNADEPFYAMRFVDGETLGQRIKQYHLEQPGSESASLQLRQLLTTMVSICNAVGFAHNRKVLHRDLKPDNVILGNFGEVSVLDWGLARLLDSPDEALESWQPIEDDRTELTMAGAIVGTPAYMAPEQARGHGKLTESTDIYALGAILYHVLTGAPPFIDKDIKQLLRQIIDEPAVSPREKNPNVAPALNSICLKALEKEPGNRYASATELADDLNRYLADEKVSAHNEGFVELARRWIRRHRTLVSSAAAAMVVAIVVLAIAAVLLNAARQRETIAKQKIASQKSAIEVARNDLQDSNEQLRIVNADLETANQRAEQSLKDARDAIDNWYTIVATNKELATTPRSSEFRKQLLQKASEYYQKFLRELPDDESLQTSAAESHIRLATIKLELEPGLAAVPHFDSAENIYNSLLTEQPDDHDLNFALAGVLNDKSAAYYQVNQVKPALELLDKAEQIYRQLSKASPTDNQLKSKTAWLTANRAEIYLKLNRLTECITAFSKSIDVHQALVKAKYEVEKSTQAMGQGYYRRGAAHIKIRKFDDAQKDLEQSLQIRRKLLTLDSANPKYRADLANSLTDFGLLAMATGKNTVAESTFREMVKIAESLTDDFPSVPKYQNDLALAFANLAKSLDRARQLDKAKTSFEDAQRVAAKLSKQFPDVPQYVSLNSELAINYAIMLANRGENAKAIEQFQHAAIVQEELTNNHPEFIRYAIGLVNTRSNLVAMHIRNHELDRSNQATVALIKDCERFIKRWPDSVDLQLTLASVYSNRGATRSQTDQSDLAQQDFETALEIREKLSKRFPDNHEVLGDLAESYNNFGIYLNSIGDKKDAIVRLEKAVRTREELAKQRPGVAANTDVAVSMFGLGQVYMLDNPQQAESLFSSSIDLLVASIQQSPQFNRAQQYLVFAGQSRAWVRWDLSKTDEAILDLEQMLHIKTPRIKNETRASLGFFLLKSGQEDRGEELLKEAQLESVITGRARVDFAAAHALLHAKILNDETLTPDARDKALADHLAKSLAGIQASFDGPRISSNENWVSITENPDFKTVAATDAFKKLQEDGNKVK